MFSETNTSRRNVTVHREQQLLLLMQSSAETPAPRHIYATVKEMSGSIYGMSGMPFDPSLKMRLMDEEAAVRAICYSTDQALAL